MRALPFDAATPDGAPTYTEVLRVPAMSVGTYVLPVGAVDPQQPHTEDEVYVILRGSGVLRTESGDAEAVPGAALFVPAGERHSFVEIEQTLEMYVVFSPAEFSLEGSGS